MNRPLCLERRTEANTGGELERAGAIYIAKAGLGRTLLWPWLWLTGCAAPSSDSAHVLRPHTMTHGGEGKVVRPPVNSSYLAAILLPTRLLDEPSVPPASPDDPMPRTTSWPRLLALGNDQIPSRYSALMRAMSSII